MSYEELMKENEELKQRLELAKEYFKTTKKEAQLADSRAVHTISRNTQKTRDNLYVIRKSLEQCIKDRKTTMTIMTNLLGFVEDIEQNLRDNGLYISEKGE